MLFINQCKNIQFHGVKMLTLVKFHYHKYIFKLYSAIALEDIINMNLTLKFSCLHFAEVLSLELNRHHKISTASNVDTILS